jgi:DNA-binding phage protein
MDNEPMEQTGWVDGHVDPAEDFDYSKVDADLGWVERGSPDIVARDETEPDRKLAHEAIRRFANSIMNHDNPKMLCCAYLWATGSYLDQDKSMTQMAEDFGVTRQALSKMVTQISEQLGVSPSRGMKSEDARKTYRRTNTWRQKHN